MKRVAGTVVAIGLLTTGCLGKGGGHSDGATVPTGRTTTSTTIDVSKVPDTITVVYANAVMRALDHVLGDAIRELVATREPTQRFVDLLQAVYDEPELDRVQSQLGQLAAEGMPNFRTNPGDPVTTVTRLISADRLCIFAETRRSLAAQLVKPPSEETLRVFVAVKTSTTLSDPAHLNPTAWSLVLDGNATGDSDPRNPCAA